MFGNPPVRRKKGHEKIIALLILIREPTLRITERQGGYGF
jgi:hypothetical protein